MGLICYLCTVHLQWTGDIQ
uniref:Uncharacterized protein n=1 Tax=Anguilla anguilla TaxID=7936 RepID=A0A0E9SNZ8_ANGAN